MRTDLLEQNRYENVKQTLILLLSMMTLMFLLGWMLGGLNGVAFAAIISITLLIVNGFHSPLLLLKTFKARPLEPQSFPELYSIIRKITLRAGLSHSPELYCVPSKVMNAFVIGKGEDAAIVLTDSLLRNLNLREVAGILGHEMAHLRNKDLWVMSVADATVRIVQFLSTLGQVLLLLALPALLYGRVQIALLPLLLLFFAPTICLILMMALSRTREYEADRMGVELVGDVYGLVSALEKLHRYQNGVLSRFFLAPWGSSQPSFHQTHPPTRERINRLLSMAGASNDRLLRVSWQHRAPHSNMFYSQRML